MLVTQRDSASRRDAARARRTAGALLRWSLRTPKLDRENLAGSRLLEGVDEATLVTLAAYHRCEGWLYEALRSVPEAPATLVATLKAARNWAAQRHMHAVWQLGRLIPVLDDADVPWAVVKGPVLAEVIHRGAGRRTYDDLDLLVHPGGFGRVVSMLERDAARLLDRNWELLRRERRGQVHLALHGGLELDLHWNLVNVHRRRMQVDTGTVLGRRQTVTVSGLTVPTLDATDTIIHLAIHAAVSGGDRLVWLKDLERAIAERPPSWEALVERSRSWRVAPAVGLMLRRAHSVLEAEVPAAVPGELLGGARSRLVDEVERRSVLEASLGGPVPSRVLARTLGHGILGGAAVLVRRAGRHFDPRGQGRYSAYTERGGPDDRDAFFAYVEAGGDRA